MSGFGVNSSNLMTKTRGVFVKLDSESYRIDCIDVMNFNF